MTRCASASQYQLWRAWVQVVRYCVTAFLPPPPRCPIVCSHPHSPAAGPGPEHRWRCAESSGWGGVVKCSSTLLLRFWVPRGPTPAPRPHLARVLATNPPAPTSPNSWTLPLCRLHAEDCPVCHVPGGLDRAHGRSGRDARAVFFEAGVLTLCSWSENVQG